MRLSRATRQPQVPPFLSGRYPPLPEIRGFPADASRDSDRPRTATDSHRSHTAPAIHLAPSPRTSGTDASPFSAESSHPSAVRISRATGRSQHAGNPSDDRAARPYRHHLEHYFGL